MINKKYFFVKIRTNRKYFLFLLFQLILSVSIIFGALFNDKHFKNTIIITGEYLLGFCIAFDLLIRLGSQNEFFKNKQNILDLVVFACLIVIIIFQSCIPEKQNSIMLQTDDIVLLAIIIIRYLIQMVRMVMMIKKSHESILMQKQNEIDLQNVQPTNKQHTQELDIQRSQILKNKILNNESNNYKEEEIPQVKLNQQN